MKILSKVFSLYVETKILDLPNSKNLNVRVK